MERTMKAAYTLFVVCGMAGSALGHDCERDYRIMLGASEEESASVVVSEVPGLTDVTGRRRHREWRSRQEEICILRALDSREK